MDTIQWQILGGDTDTAITMIENLSIFFRKGLNHGCEYTTLRNEITHVQSYFKIQAIRFPKLHQLSIDIDDGLMDQPVMHFILQPLVVDEGTSRSLAMNVKDYIETHYSEKGLSLSQVASALFVNEGYLSRQLKQTYGRTFSEYLIEYRIQKAQELLRNLTLQYTVTAIANKVGYEDPHYFSRLFRKKTGFSPVQFREHAELLPNSNRE